MKILVMHTVPYRKMEYHRALDHDAHDITYIGAPHRMADLPPGLPATRIVIPGIESRSTEICREVSPEDGYEWVMALSEFDLHEAGRVRAHLNVPGPRYEELLKYKDKVLMKTLVRGAGVRAPDFVDLRGMDRGRLASLRDSLAWQGRTILKPILGASSVGVHRFESPQEAIDFLLTSPEADTYFQDGDLEEYVEGTILHVDGVSEGGAPLLMVASRYINTPLEYVGGKPLGSMQFKLSEDYRAFFTASLRAVGITDGAFHLEVIEGPRGLVFMEVANRAGGGDIIPTTEASTGLHIPSEEIKVLLRKQRRLLGIPDDGEPRSTPFLKDSGPWFGWFCIPGHQLESAHARVEFPDWMAGSSNIVKLAVTHEERPLLKSVTHQYWEVATAGIVQGQDSREVETLVRRICDEVRVIPV
ncbi:acetyl-CoA carboxylase biotin carboxylase subunit family protein [Corallococcus exercitus]|uniref:ATP-grasp domain-containing protein n=1 Tax=Corallococcus exercitus TaxID=2316736 RepID=UPI0035D4E11A